MPAFFAVAGFFAALLYERDGERGFLRNRARRVLAPLVIFWAAVGPFVLGGFYFAITHGGRMTGDELLASVGSPVALSNLSPMHLWFLWYLVLFYAATVACIRVTGRIAPRAAVAAALTTAWWCLPFWSIVTTLTLLPMDHPGIDASPLLVPDPRPVVAYGVFFVFGWLLHRGRGALARLTRWWSWRAPAAIFATAVPSALVIASAGDNAPVVHAAGCAAIAASTWALVLAAFGAFLRHAPGAHPVVRYLSDGAYWIYIIHLPIVIWLAGLLARAPLHAGVKFTIVLSLTTVACLASYHAFVRSTVVGQLLNGRRQPPLAPGVPDVPGVPG
jgi:peptidoglycan/LPS O-acetylase OafA/YrhL